MFRNVLPFWSTLIFAMCEVLAFQNLKQLRIIYISNGLSGTLKYDIMLAIMTCTFLLWLVVFSITNFFVHSFWVLMHTGLVKDFVNTGCGLFYFQVIFSPSLESVCSHMGYFVMPCFWGWTIYEKSYISSQTIKLIQD